MAVRTKRLAAADSAPASAEHIIYTCPTGETTILKEVRLSWQSGTISRAVVFVDSGPVRVSLVDQAVGNLDVVTREVWTVLSPGDEVGVFSSGGAFGCWLSGTELAGVAD